MKENQKFPTPIITPTTKADEGHDMNISKEEIIAQGIVSKEDYDAAPDAIKAELKPYTEQVWDINTIREQFKDAIEAAKKYGLQLFCGEWGVYEPVDRELAYNWTRDMLTVFDEFNIAWTTWCYDADFGFWDQQHDCYKDKPLVDLLTGK